MPSQYTACKSAQWYMGGPMALPIPSIPRSEFSMWWQKQWQCKGQPMAMMMAGNSNGNERSINGYSNGKHWQTIAMAIQGIETWNRWDATLEVSSQSQRRQSAASRVQQYNRTNVQLCPNVQHRGHSLAPPCVMWRKSNAQTHFYTLWCIVHTVFKCF